MHLSNNFLILPLIFAIIGTPVAFAQVELNGVNIFCPLEELLDFIGIVPFLEICPINTTVPTPLEPQVSISNFNGPEGDDGDSIPLIFTVSLNTVTSLSVSVDFSTIDDTATIADIDYMATSGTINFASGETSKSIGVLAIGDNRIESDETFRVLLSNCINCVILDGVGVGTLVEAAESFNQATKDFWQGWVTASQQLQIALFGLAPFTAVALPGEIVSCIALGGPSLGISCIPLAVTVGLSTIPPAVEFAAQGIVDDPPDSNFEQVFLVPSFQVFESEGFTESGVALVNMLNVLSEQAALQQAFLTSFERYQGAALANEPEFVALQLSAVKVYTDLLIENQLELQDAFLEYRTAFLNGISEEELEQIQNRLDNEGFSDDEIQELLDLGYSQVQIDEIKQGIIALDQTKILTLTNALNQGSDSLEPLIADLRTFSNELDEFLPSLREQKEGIKQQLESKIEDAQSKDTKKKIEKALELIENSLDEELWVDDRHLVADDGKKVFNEEKKAVKKLMRIIKDEKEDQTFLDMIQDVIDRIVDVDKSLATIALLDAQEFVGDKKADKQIEKANNQIEKAENDIDDGKFEKAIEQYRKAWKHAQKAMNDEMPDPDEDDDDEEDDE